jgi:hypothetical protein
MVRKTHHGRPGTRVIPDDWGERHAPAANQAHTATCEIRGPDALGPFDPNTGAYDVEPGPLRYSGTCRVQRAERQAIEGLVSEQELPAVAYEVSIDRGATAVQRRDLVKITLSEDAQLTGQSFPVVAVIVGSMQISRILYCLDDLTAI